MIVLPGGGYAEHAPYEAEPVASWLNEIGVQASVFRYPLNVRHPAPLDALRAEIGRRRAGGAQRIGLIGFSAGGHLAGLAALAPGAAPDESVQFAVLGYAITSMETETYRPARLILLGEEASPQLRRSTSLDSLVTPQSPPFFVWHTAEDPYVPPEHTYRFASALAASHVPHTVHMFAHGPTALAWPRTLARPRSGPRWRMPGSMNRRHRRDDSAGRTRWSRGARDGAGSSRSSFYLKSTRQSHEVAFRRCYCGVRLRGSEIKHVYDRAPDVFLPGKQYQAIANRDCLIVDGIGETDTVTRDDFHGYWGGRAGREVIPSGMTPLKLRVFRTEV